MGKVTSMDVARLAGVSQSTVSAVMTNNNKIKVSAETRKKVLDAAKELRYGPFARPAVASNLNLIAVFVPTLSNPFYPHIVSYLEEIFQENNLNMILCCTGKDPDREYDQLANFDTYNVSGIIYAFTPSHYEPLIRLAEKMPVIIIGESDHDGITTVALDSKRAGYIAAKHLYELGHRRIAFVSEDTEAVSLSRKRRLEGIVQFVDETPDMQDIVICTGENENRDDIGIGHMLTQRLLDNPKNDVTAIIGVNDYTAIGILNAARERDLAVPGQISVMGFDNIEMSHNVTPTLTTIDHIINERCRQAVDIMLNGSVTKRITYNPVLTEGESTGSPPVQS